MALRFLLSALISLLLVGSAGAGQPGEDAIRVTPSRSEVEIGERMTLRIQVEANLPVVALDVTLPDEQRPMLRPGSLRQLADREFELPIRPLRRGQHRYGPFDFELQLEGVDEPVPLTTGGFSLNVLAPPEEEAADLRDYTGPLDLPFNYAWRNLILAGSGLAALALLALMGLGIVVWMRRRAELASQVPPIPPIEMARERLARLQTLETYDQEGAERHYTELSMLLRRYLEDQMGFHTAEMTEDEVVELIRGPLKTLNKSDTLVELFRRSSMAKFARNPLTRDHAAQDCLTAQGFLLAEKARLDALQAAMEREQSRRSTEEGKRAA